MIVNKSWIKQFFASANESFILNILYVLQFMLQVPVHHKRLNEIFAEAGIEADIKSFTDSVSTSIILYETKLKEDSNYLMKDFTVKAGIINAIENTPIYWLFIAIYWGYDFKNNTNAVIIKDYNWRIGDVVLKFLLYFLKMQRQTLRSGKSPRIGFFPDLATRLVRIVDILIALSKLNNRYIRKMYLPNIDLAQNFLNVQCNNPWLCDAFSVVKDIHIGRGVFQFNHEVENIKLNIYPTRMVKVSALNGLCDTLKDLINLYSLGTKKSTHNYRGIKIPKVKSSTFQSTTYKFVEIVDELSEELIYEDVAVGSDTDTKAEAKIKANIYSRHMKPVDSDEENDVADEEYKIPNAHVQHKRNRAFSSSVTKQNLLLPSDYSIPPIEQLKTFIKFLQKGVQNA